MSVDQLPEDSNGNEPRDRTATSIINKIVAGSLRQRFLILFFAVLLICGGIYSFRRLPVDAYPDLSPPQVEIVTQWEGHAAEEVERLITVPMETEMNGLPGLTGAPSISVYGLPPVPLPFNRGTDRSFARQQVFERLPDAELPD